MAKSRRTGMPRGMTVRSRKRAKATPPGMARRAAAFQAQGERVTPARAPKAVPATKRRNRGI
jgi:hypothetical protein